MSSAINFNTANQTYRQLVGNALIYHVPMFQRDYSWTDTEWDDLWQDIEDILKPNGEPAHYMGYLVLKSEDQKFFEIIDGQQRLTTLSILILALLYHLDILIKKNSEAAENKQRYQQLRNTFIGYLDPVTLIPSSKLNLNRNNDDFYQKYLVTLENAPKRGLKATEHLMRKAFDWFKSSIKTYTKDNLNGRNLAKIAEALADKLFFTVITVTDELNAFKVFETLNARGVRLSSTDLLKNYLFSIVYKTKKNERELNELDKRWLSLTDNLGSQKLPDFLRTYWNSKNRFVRHAQLFKVIRSSIAQRGEVFELVRNLEENANVYAALSKPEDELWLPEQKKYIRELNMFSVRQLNSLLLAGYRDLLPHEFTQLLKACSIISFRYNVIGRMNPGDQEKVYNSVAEKISNGKLVAVNDIINALRSVYPNDEQFKTAFAQKQLSTTQSRNKHILRYILFSIESQTSKKDYDLDSEKYNIEHILPESPEDNWNQFDDTDFHQSVFRLGNMTILTKKANNEAANKDFDNKKKIYLYSDFQITKKISEENAEWNTERIATRQKWMAKQAISIWKISQLS